jgi:protein SCO1
MSVFRVGIGVCAVAGLLSSTASCGRGNEYELRGQVLAVDPDRQEVTIKHEDIRGFMPGMTMPFKVRSTALLSGRKPGELVRATLVVEESSAYLTAIESTGHAPLTDTAPLRPRIDILNPGDVVPDASFVDERGAPRTLAAWRGTAIALTFIYTRCPVPDFCPLMDRRFAELQRAVLEDVALRGRVHLVSVSFDPAFDTPAVLAAHAKKVGADGSVWSFLTGDRSEIDRFSSRLGVSIVQDRESAPEIVHNLRTAVIDGDGRLVRIFTGNEWTVAELLPEMKTAVRSVSAPR